MDKQLCSVFPVTTAIIVAFSSRSNLIFIPPIVAVAVAVFLFVFSVRFSTNMSLPEAIAILLSCSLFFYLLHKLWWTPLRIRRAMSSQGIRGPSYRFIHGNNREILKMRARSMSKPMDNLSHDIFPRVQPHLHSWLNTYGKSFVMWYGPIPKPQLVVAEPEFVKEILSNRERTYPKPEAEGYMKKLLGDGLVTSEGEKWAKLRKLVNHAFYAENLKNMVPDMIQSVEMMLERWKHQEGKEIEVLEEFRLLTSEVISRTAFGSNYSEGEGIFEMLRKLGAIASRNNLKIRLPVISLLWRSRDEMEAEKLEQGIGDSILGMIKKRERAMNEVDGFGTDLLGLLVKANKEDDESKRISLEDVVDECKTFYLAGHETTTKMLAWTVLLLAIHTDWQEKAREEVINLFGREHPNPEGFARMKTMNMIMNESLRLYPPVINIIRKVQREVRLGTLIFPANLNIVIPVLALNHNPQVWGEDLHIFKPERFAEGVAKATGNNPAVYLPFGLGPRSCVGMNFAMNEAKIALSMILQRYAFTLSPTYIHSPIHVLTVHPGHGIQVRLQALPL